MFAPAYFAPRCFPGRYFAAAGAAVAVPPPEFVYRNVTRTLTVRAIDTPLGQLTAATPASAGRPLTVRTDS